MSPHLASVSMSSPERAESEGLSPGEADGAKDWPPEALSTGVWGREMAVSAHEEKSLCSHTFFCLGLCRAADATHGKEGHLCFVHRLKG